MLIPNLDDDIISASECLIDQNSFEISQKKILIIINLKQILLIFFEKILV